MINMYCCCIFKFMKKFVFIIFLVVLSKNVLQDKKNNEKNAETKKRRNMIDIDSLREKCVYALVELLSLIEKKLQKIHVEKNYAEFERVLPIFKWVNECVDIFIHDPSLFGRSEIEACLNNASKHTSFLNSI